MLELNCLDKYLNSFPIYICTVEHQRRKHRKKRINKKWKKIYGVEEFNTIPHGKVYFNQATKSLYMTKRTYEELKYGKE